MSLSSPATGIGSFEETRLLFSPQPAEPYPEKNLGLAFSKKQSSLRPHRIARTSPEVACAGLQRA